MDRLELTIQGRKVSGITDGPADGAVVCLCHALTTRANLWSEQVPALVSAGYRVVAFDMRGHGDSDPTPGRYSMELLAEDLVLGLDALGVDRVHLVGLSIGGMVSQAFAIRNVHRLHSLVLSSTLPASVPNATDLWRPRVEAVLAAGSVAAIADSTLDRWLSDDYRQANPRRWGEIQEMVASTSVDGFLGCVGALEDFDFRDELPTLSAPSLVVCGARDSSSTPEANRAIASMLKARYEEIPDALHLVPVEKSEQFGALLLSWLNDTRSS